jgi:predicted DNA-binding transcriptional regulator AlpA
MQMKSDRFLDLEVMRELTSRSNSTITRWVKSNKLPSPVDIGTEPYQPTYRWLASEVEAFLKIQILTPEEIQDRLLDLGEVRVKISASHSTIAKWRSHGHFPEPVSNTGTNNYWSRIAIDEWIAKIFAEDREKY